jgi:uncharacterized protein (DUF1697 family)
MAAAAGELHVALLRGVNVGGKNKLPMKDLVVMLEDAGCQDVRTYIQSGNVVFSAGAARAARIPAVIAEAVAARLGFRPPVVMRTAKELAAVGRANPFLRRGTDPDSLHVVFLADEPPPARVATLDPSRSPPDELVVRGREVYLRCPNGLGRSKLTNAWFDSKLATTSTIRNWRTVLKLIELTAG